MNWWLSHRADDRTRRIADRHYNRQKIGTPQFVPPGRCLVLVTQAASAFWITSWPFGEYVKHRWPGAWVCSAFRNESPVLSSALIREAVAATLWRYGAAPDIGMVTFVNREKVRAKRDPGYCFLMAGFERDGETEGGLVALRLPPSGMPPAEAPLGSQTSIFTSEVA